MHLTRRELLNDFLVLIGEEGDPDALNTAKILLNSTLTTLWMAHPWTVFRSPVPVEITLVAGQSRYSLPDHFGRVGPGRVRNLTTGAPLDPFSKGQIDELYPLAGTDVETRGTPAGFEIVGTSGVHTQPDPNGEAIEAVSDNAADTDIRVGVAGDDSDGRMNRSQATLSGTNAVSLGIWTYIDEVAKAYLESADPATPFTSSRGTVTIRTVADQTELQKLFTQESARDHAVIRFVPTPDAATTIAIPMMRKPKRLLYDADAIPDLWEPAVREELMIQWAVNVGDLTKLEAEQTARPALLNLIAHDNVSQPRPRTQGWGRR